MELTLTLPQLARYTATQINTFFPDGNPVSLERMEEILPRVLERLSHCLQGIGSPYFKREGKPFFNHLHSDQYSMYLYLLANESHIQASLHPSDLAVKSYLLNKALHGIEAYYQINLPNVFWFAHAMGSVLGRASYGNKLVVMQGCTIGNKDGEYPTLGEQVVLCAKSTVLGGVVGSNVCIGAGSLVIGETIPDNSTVVGSSPNLRIVNKQSNLIDLYFHKDNSHARP
ncbi:MAG: serine acetyltransferase [Verrucomicrobiota bacterium]